MKFRLNIYRNIALIFLFFISCNNITNNSNKITDLQLLQNKILISDLNNNKLDVNLYYGKKTIVNYWATWCGPCIKEMPEIENAQRLLKDDVNFIIVSDEEIHKILDFENKKKFNLTLYKSMKSNEIAGVFSLPTSHIFDEKGKKIKTIIGSTKWDSDDFLNKLRSL